MTVGGLTYIAIYLSSASFLHLLHLSSFLAMPVMLHTLVSNHTHCFHLYSLLWLVVTHQQYILIFVHSCNVNVVVCLVEQQVNNSKSGA
jgi:hypothetical protein